MTVLIHRVVADYAIAFIDPFRVDDVPMALLPEPLVPSGFEAEAHLMPQFVHLRRFDSVQRDALLDWLEGPSAGDGAPPVLAFVSSDADDARVLNHLRRQLIIGLSGDRKCLLRYYDPKVFWHLHWILDETQRASLFGPLRQWVYWHDGLWRLSEKPLAGSRRPVPLSQRQSAQLGRVATINQVMASIELPVGATARLALAQRVDADIERAQRKGLGDEMDWIHFARLCHTCHPRFDEHPRVVDLLACLAQDECTFSDVAAAMDDMFWQGVATELAEAEKPNTRDLIR
ncbi:DUF4123 domain-containing protein [Zoogloeaceae bacterium G21618-S1]|nr:DUF4123 domain-containing protein [Zoogloeaceae bacterium G21618-S1]